MVYQVLRLLQPPLPSQAWAPSGCALPEASGRRQAGGAAGLGSGPARLGALVPRLGLSLSVAFPLSGQGWGEGCGVQDGVEFSLIPLAWLHLLLVCPHQVGLTHPTSFSRPMKFNFHSHTECSGSDDNTDTEKAGFY